MKLAWNAIVKNEAGRIGRCVSSLLPAIDCGIVVDTGSTDGTPGVIHEMFRQAGKPVEIYTVPFENFGQARNAALHVARASSLEWDYLLLADADMELVGSLSVNELNGLSYDMLQRVGALEYYNRRLVSRKATGWYEGVTHEYLDIPSAGSVNGAWFRDYADGANRPDKFARDIVLLEEALKTETRPGIIQRYEFYLAQSYFDSGNWTKAAEHYKRRTELGGYEEEVWNAQLHYAHCLENMGNKPGFVWEMLQAYGMRPSRAETLYDLAKYFRERGQNHVSLLFSDVPIAKPPDQLFVNDYVYQHGLREEFAICAYYDPLRRQRGAEICDQLALERGANVEQARNNLVWYLKPLIASVPSFKPTRLLFPEHRGYVPMNPSIARYKDKLYVLVRTVNYRIDPEGRYVSGTGDFAPDGTPIIRTRNFLCRLSADLNVDLVAELQLPWDLPKPQYQLVRGFEDSRIFEWKGELWTLSTVRELNPEGWCEQVIASINGRTYDDWQKILPKQRQNEKNWMPWVAGDDLHFVYRLGRLVDRSGELVAEHDTGLDLAHVSGGSQAIAITPEWRLALVHEARTIPGRGTRYYQHRFVLFSGDGQVVGISPAFYFHDRQIEFALELARSGEQLALSHGGAHGIHAHDRQIEFAAGLALSLDSSEIIVSYGVRDCEAWLATMQLEEVLRFIES